MIWFGMMWLGIKCFCGFVFEVYGFVGESVYVRNFDSKVV